MRRVVVTGMGVVSCLGNSVKQLWQALLAGKSGLQPMQRWNPEGLRNALMGEVVDFPWDDLHDEASQFALFAARRALESAKLADGGDVAIVSSTNFGGAASWDQYVACLIDDAVSAETSEFFHEFGFSRAAELISEECALTGPRRVLSLSCSSGTCAIGQGLDMIRLGKTDIALCEGHDSLAYSSMAGLSILRTISNDLIRPFDKRRNGTLFGEGAAALVLEEAEHAEQRGATIYGEVLGYAVNNNAHHLTAPDKEGEGLVAMLQEALRDAGSSPQDIDYVNAHGTGTAYFDVTETRALKTVLGERAYHIPVSSIKAATGHMMAAAGSVEAIATLCALHDGIAPPTLNLDEADPECDLDYLPWKPRAAEMRQAISISSGIGGNNSAIVLKRWQ